MTTAEYEADRVRLAAESDRRSAIRNLNSVLMHLTGTGVPPVTFADRYFGDILAEPQYTTVRLQYAIDVLGRMKEAREAGLREAHDVAVTAARELLASVDGTS